MWPILTFALRHCFPKGDRRKCFPHIARMAEKRRVKTFLLLSRMEIWHSAVSMPSLIAQGVANEADSAADRTVLW